MREFVGASEDDAEEVAKRKAESEAAHEAMLRGEEYDKSKLYKEKDSN